MHSFSMATFVLELYFDGALWTNVSFFGSIRISDKCIHDGKQTRRLHCRVIGK